MAIKLGFSSNKYYQSMYPFSQKLTLSLKYHLPDGYISIEFGSIQEARPWSVDQFAFCQLTGPRTSLRSANWSADQFAKW